MVVFYVTMVNIGIKERVPLLPLLNHEKEYLTLAHLDSAHNFILFNSRKDKKNLIESWMESTKQ